MKKIVSLTAIFVLIATSATPGFAASKATRANVSSYTSSAGYAKNTFATSKLGKLQPSVIANMRKLEKSALASLSGSTQKEYKKLLDSSVLDTNTAFSTARSMYFYDEASATAGVVAEVAKFNALIAEIKNLPADATPFAVSDAEKSAVEAGIIETQKDLLVPLMKKALKNYKESELKETGEMHTSVTTDAGKFSLDINRYTSILSVLGLSQEVDFAGKLSYEMKVPTLGTYNKTTGEYTPGTPTTVSGSVSADATVKMIDSKMYITLKDATLEMNENETIGITKNDIAKFQKLVTYMKGKTFVADLSNQDGEMNGAKTLANFTKTVDVLSANALFTPKRKVGESYALVLNDATLKKVVAIYDESAAKDEIKASAEDLNLFYREAGGVRTITANIQDNSAYGTAVLTKKSGAYAFDMNLVGRGSSTGNTVKLSATKDTLELDVKMPSSKSEIAASWRDDTLMFYVLNDTKRVFEASGALSEKKANLVFSVNAKQVGTLKVDTVGTDEYTYSMTFASDAASEIGTAIKFEMSGKEKLESGKFPITTPTDTTPITTLEKMAKKLK